MNTNEGSRRIIVLGKRTMLFGSLATLPLLGLYLWSQGVQLNRTGVEVFTLIGAFVIAVPLLLGAIVWGIGWVVQGFQTSSDQK